MKSCLFEAINTLCISEQTLSYTYAAIIETQNPSKTVLKGLFLNQQIRIKKYIITPLF